MACPNTRSNSQPALTQNGQPKSIVFEVPHTISALHSLTDSRDNPAPPPCSPLSSQPPASSLPSPPQAAAQNPPYNPP